MRAVAILVCFFAAIALCGAANVHMQTCVASKLYLETGSVGTLYSALVASTNSACRGEALRVACAISALAHYGVSQEHVVCTLDCAGYMTERCPDVFQVSPQCEQVSPTECAARMRNLANILLG